VDSPLLTSAQIWAYLQRCAREFGILPHIRFKHEVQSAR
jgi:cation diffusion facilitator CzcD-associated flavoprotein CzcO